MIPTLPCPSCQAHLDPDECFCPVCGTRAHEPAAPTTTVRVRRVGCPSCGASTCYDAEARGMACPFCGSVQVLDQGIQDLPDAQRVVPFRMDADQAVQALRAWLGQAFWAPRDAAAQAQVEAARAVRLPCWVFTARTRSSWTADVKNRLPEAKAAWRPVSGELDVEVDDLYVVASGALRDDEVRGLKPFDLGAAVAAEHLRTELATIPTTEAFALPRSAARRRAHAAIEGRVRATVAGDLPAGPRRNLRVQVQVQGLAAQRLLVPVWIFTYRYRDRPYRLLVNGQTGAVVGAAPLSWWKVGAALLVLAALALAMARWVA